MNSSANTLFHLFSHRGRPYVIFIEAMRALALDDSTAEILKTPAFQRADPPAAALRLRELGLLTGEERKKPRPPRKEPYSIVNMCLFLTQSCNLNCVYFYGDGGGYGSGGSLTAKTAFRAVDWLIEQSGPMKHIRLGFFGGEPFLQFPLMRKITAYAEKRARETAKEVEFHCTTNATLLDEEQIAFILKHRLSVMVSIDGPREIHDAQRPFAGGGGSYAVILPKIKQLLAVLPDTPGHAVLTGSTDPQAVKAALREIGFRKLSVITSSQCLFNNEEKDGEKRERDISRLLAGLEEEGETWLSLIRSRDSRALEELKDKSGLSFALMALLHRRKLYHACSAGLGMAAVSVTGDVYLCQRFVGREEYKLGTVFASHLERREYEASPAESNPRCTPCPARYYCAGGCKHDNLGSGGSLSTPPEELCRLRRRELELAAAVIGRLKPEDQAFLTDNGIFPPKPCPLDF